MTKIKFSNLSKCSDYKGCFLDKPRRDLAYSINPKVKQPGPDECFVQCNKLGFRYAAIQNGGECFCGNSFGRYGSLPQNMCKCPCKGDAIETCGCEWSNKVYELRSAKTVCDEPEVCGAGALCKVVNGRPECSCKPGIKGDPKVRCCSKPFFCFVNGTIETRSTRRLDGLV